MKKFLLTLLTFLILPCFAVDETTKILPSQTGIVENVQYVDLDDENVSQTKQTIDVKIISGEFKGEVVELDNMLTGNPYYDIKLKNNTDNPKEITIKYKAEVVNDSLHKHN